MKISNKISLIAGVSTLALVGTAFAAWQFNKNATKEVESNVVITKDTSVGEITLSQNTWFLTLDQNSLCWTKTSFADSESAVTASDILETVTVTYTGGSSNNVSDVTLGVSYNADAAIATYVTVSDGSLGAATESGNTKSAVYTLPSLTWVAKPTTQAAFNAMKTALESAKVTFTFTATVA